MQYIAGVMRIGYAQMEPRFGEPQANLAKARELISAHRADLWVLPELFNTGYLFASQEEAHELAEPLPGGPTTQQLVKLAKASQTHIVAGMAERAGTQVYNSALLIAPEGLVGTYRKVHLFAEEKRWFVPGDTVFPVFDLGWGRVGILICFDHFFPEAARTLALRGADIVAHPANLVMPGIAQRTMTVRAMENRVFTVTANRVGQEHRGGRSLRFTGCSQIVSPEGVLLASSPEGGADVQVVDVAPVSARDKRLNPWNDLLADRRPELYAL